MNCRGAMGRDHGKYHRGPGEYTTTMEPSSTTGHNTTTGKETTTTCAERRRANNAVDSLEQGDIYNHDKNDQIGSGDYTETPGGRGTIRICHGKNIDKGTIHIPGHFHARSAFQGLRGCNKLGSG
jgi:hypothetical protein